MIVRTFDQSSLLISLGHNTLQAMLRESHMKQIVPKSQLNTKTIKQ